MNHDRFVCRYILHVASRRVDKEGAPLVLPGTGALMDMAENVEARGVFHASNSLFQICAANLFNVFVCSVMLYYVYVMTQQ